MIVLKNSYMIKSNFKIALETLVENKRFILRQRHSQKLILGVNNSEDFVYCFSKEENNKVGTWRLRSGINIYFRSGNLPIKILRISYD